LVPLGVKQGKRRRKQEKESPPPSRITVELVNYHRRFLDSIGNVEYPGALLERDRRTASDVQRERAREMERAIEGREEESVLAIVESNDLAAWPFIELVAKSCKVPSYPRFLLEKINSR